MRFLRRLRAEEKLFPALNLDGRWQLIPEAFSSGGRERLALVYPGTYTEGMSSLGFQQVWKLFKLQGFDVQRAFIDDSFFIDGTYRSLEEARDLRRFPILAISVAYELQIFKLLELYRRLGISPERKPFTLILGGPITYINPKPFQPLVDVIARGDGELLVPIIADAVRGGALPDVIPQEGVAILSSLEPAYTPILTPRSEFSMALLVEVNRGCGFRCRFCVVPSSFGRLRLVDESNLKELLELFLNWSPIERPKIGFVTTFLGPVWVRELALELSERAEISFSSIRPEFISEELLRALVRSGQQSVTVAPETGSEELRAKLGKSFSNQFLLDKLRLARAVGLTKLKVYLMLGAPEELDEHVEETAKLLRDISSVGFGEVRVSVSVFTPKPNTPYAEAPFPDERLFKHRLRLLRRAIRDLRGVRLSVASYREAKLEWEIAHGDQELGYELLRRYLRDS